MENKQKKFINSKAKELAKELHKEELYGNQIARKTAIKNIKKNGR